MLNMDFGQRVLIDTNNREWIASPQPGVWRKPLAREDAERGHATSIVKFDAGSRFKHHDHPLGEEILVLDGIFSDETGDYPAGSYFRNPRGFRHAPFSEAGCVILVKLHQFQPDDTSHVCLDTTSNRWLPGKGRLQVMPLHNFRTEQVALVKWPAGEHFPAHEHWGGEEVFVLHGELIDEHGRYPAGTWIRNPPMSQHHPYVDEDTLIWIKVGHLRDQHSRQATQPVEFNELTTDDKSFL